MRLLYISTFMFHQSEGKTLGLPSCSDAFFEKYLAVFDAITVLGEQAKSYLDKSGFVEIRNPKIAVRILLPNTKPKDFINDRILAAELKKEISDAEAILIKPASRRGMLAIRIAEKLGKPYMIEMTGDIHNALMQSTSIIKKMYAPVLYRQIKHTIRNCEYGLYVSKEYLQGKYPIRGKVCGCSDVFLQKSDPQVLEQRLQKIENMTETDAIKIALIGFYQGNGKGVDTAIRALSRLPGRFELSILGNGTEENRKKWYEYGKRYGVSETRIHFPEPLPNTTAVLAWLDGFDFFILPTRSEGFGRCVAEAESRGCPCFATNICTMPELLAEECLHDLDDDEKLADLVLACSKDKNKMKRLATINFEKAKEYEISILTDRRNEFLSEFKEYCATRLGSEGL